MDVSLLLKDTRLPSMCLERTEEEILKEKIVFSIASLAEIASTGNLRRRTIYELPRLIARCIKICNPNGIYSIKMKGSRVLVSICQSHPAGIASVPSSCSFMQNSCELEMLTGQPGAHVHHRSLADIDH